MSLQLDLADIATNEKKLLKGFKVLGLMPFYLHYITVNTHIKLCKIKEQINEIVPGEAKLGDFYDSVIQETIIPYIQNYCVTALVNERLFGFFFRILLMQKIKKCGHFHIFNLYFTILKLDEPAFFLSYWNSIKKLDNTIYKGAEQS
jgi:hypothetical protein